LEAHGPARIRLLCQCEPGRRSSALEPGAGNPHRRGRLLQPRPARDAALQRLWRAGRRALCRHGPRGELLTITQRRRALAIWALYAAGFVPAVVWFWLGATGRIPGNAIKEFEHVLGIWALRFLLATLMVTPLRDLAGVNLMRYRRALGLLAFWYALMHFSSSMVLDKGLDLASILADIAKRPFIT